MYGVDAAADEDVGGTVGVAGAFVFALFGHELVDECDFLADNGEHEDQEYDEKAFAVYGEGNDVAKADCCDGGDGEVDGVCEVEVSLFACRLVRGFGF